MEEHSHRDYLTWMAHLRDEWNTPSRADNYMMQIALEIRRIYLALVRKPRPLSLKDMILRFGKSNRHHGDSLQTEESRPDVEAITRRAKAKWFGWLKHTKAVEPPKEEHPEKEHLGSD